MAIAGGLNKDDIDLVRDFGADIMGLRRAVCNKLTGKVEKNLLVDFMKKVKES